MAGTLVSGMEAIMQMAFAAIRRVVSSVYFKAFVRSGKAAFARGPRSARATAEQWRRN